MFDGAALGEQMQELVSSPGFTPAAFAVAFLAGAAHALGPGHGKSLAAAYLIGAGGRVRDAAWLGGSVAVMTSPWTRRITGPTPGPAAGPG